MTFVYYCFTLAQKSRTRLVCFFVTKWEQRYEVSSSSHKGPSQYLLGLSQVQNVIKHTIYPLYSNKTPIFFSFSTLGGQRLFFITNLVLQIEIPCFLKSCRWYCIVFVLSKIVNYSYVRCWSIVIIIH